MADNITRVGGGAETFATDDVNGVQYPRTKITVGADGVTDGDVSTQNPLPITAAQLTELIGLQKQILVVMNILALQLALMTGTMLDPADQTIN